MSNDVSMIRSEFCTRPVTPKDSESAIRISEEVHGSYLR